MRGGGEDGAIVGFQNLEPMRKVLRMIGSRRVGDFEMTAKCRCRYLSTQLFGRILVIAEARAELAIDARCRPVRNCCAPPSGAVSPDRLYSCGQGALLAAARL